MEIPVIANVRKQNAEVAEQNRRQLRGAGVVCINLIGSPGAGKTALLEKTLAALGGQLRVAVLTGDLTTTRDAERLARHCPLVRQINTGKGCHLNASQVQQGIRSLPLDRIDLLVIENVGNLICPVGTDLGQDVKVGMFSVTEGDDKPAKHPYLVLESQLLLLNKTDLLPHVPFDLDVFCRDVRQMREDVPILQLSALTGEGLAAWLTWVQQLVRGAAQVAPAGSLPAQEG